MQPATQYDLPLDPDTAVWRYLDMEKAIDLFETSEMYLRAAAHFQSDPLEAKMPGGDFAQLRKELSPEIAAAYELVSNLNSRHVYVSCWHINDDENSRMWSEYVAGDTGIAIRSTAHRILASLPQTTQAEVSAVRYISHASFETQGHSVSEYAFVKDLPFSWEREARLAIREGGPHGGLVSTELRREVPNHIRCPVSLNNLVAAIRFKSTTSPTDREYLKGLLATNSLLGLVEN
jgi:hypothetical protein